MGLSPTQRWEFTAKGQGRVSREEISKREHQGLDGPGAREMRPQLGLQAGGKPERIPR